MNFHTPLAGAEAQESTISARIRARLESRGIRFFANDAIAEHLEPGELEEMESELAECMGRVLDALVIDRACPNARNTARRMAQMYLHEVFEGRYTSAPELTEFPNGKKLDELYTLGPIAVRSTCAHHFCPVLGDLWVGVIPGDKVVGISKFVRLSRWILNRPQMQEEAVVQLADALEDAIKPRGLGVVLRAKHTCMTWRGVKEHDTVMQTNVMRGILREGPAARAEFFAAIGLSN
jgi:GTP cyclohydrolase I